MRRAVTLALAAVLMAGTAAFAAPAGPAYKAPRNSLGQPDFSGYWSNASLTPEARPATLG